MMMTVVEVKMTTTTRTFGDGEKVDLIDNNDDDDDDDDSNQ